MLEANRAGQQKLDALSKDSDTGGTSDGRHVAISQSLELLYALHDSDPTLLQFKLELCGCMVRASLDVLRETIPENSLDTEHIDQSNKLTVPLRAPAQT